MKRRAIFQGCVNAALISSIVSGLLIPTNAVVAADPQPPPQYPPISADAYTAAIRLMEEFAREQIENLPSADKNPRENMFGIMSLICMGGTVGGLSLPIVGGGMGTGIGGIVGAIAGSPAAGVGAVPGAALGGGAGGSFGLAAGVAGGTAVFVGSLVLCVPILLYTEEKYPYDKYQTQPASSAIVRAVAFAPKAALQETFFVNLIVSLPNEIITLAEKWDRTPGLSAVERDWLRSISFARKDIERIAWIKKNRRISPSSPVADDLIEQVTRTIKAINDAAEDAWLAALGLGSVEMRLSRGNLVVETPPTLHGLGFPEKFSSSIDNFRLRIGGSGGAFDPWVQVLFKPGPFDIQWGKVSLVRSGPNKDLVKVAYDIKSGSRVGTADFEYKWGGSKKEIFDFEPKMGSDFKGSLYFRLDGLTLQFVKADINGFDLQVKLPRDLEETVGVLRDEVVKLASQFAKKAEDTFGADLPWKDVFEGHRKASTKSLERELKLAARKHGMVSIDKLEHAEVENGRLVARVKGTAIKQPPPIMSNEELKRRFDQFSAARSSVKRPLSGITPKI